MAGMPVVISLLARPRMEPVEAMGPATRLGNDAGWVIARSVVRHCPRTTDAVSITSTAEMAREKLASLINPYPLFVLQLPSNREWQYSKVWYLRRCRTNGTCSAAK